MTDAEIETVRMVVIFSASENNACGSIFDEEPVEEMLAKDEGQR